MELVIEDTQYIPIEEAAREMGTTHLQILIMIRRNMMQGFEVDGEWYVEKSAIAGFKGLDMDDKKTVGCRASCASGGCGGGN